MILKDEFNKKEYYYISFDFFINTLKYRIKILEEKMRKIQKSPSELKNKYICSNRCCDENNDLIIYTTESIASIGSLKCPECNKKGRVGEIEQCELTKTNTRQIGLVKKLATQLEPITNLLRQLEGQSWDKRTPAEVKMAEAEAEAAAEEERMRKLQYGSGIYNDTNASSTKYGGSGKFSGNTEQQQIFSKIGNDGFAVNVKIAQVGEDWLSNPSKRQKLDNNNSSDNSKKETKSELPEFIKTSSITGRKIVGESSDLVGVSGNDDNNNDIGKYSSIAMISNNNESSNDHKKHNISTTVSFEQAEEFFKQSNPTIAVDKVAEEMEEEEEEEDESSDDDF